MLVVPGFDRFLALNSLHALKRPPLPFTKKNKQKNTNTHFLGFDRGVGVVILGEMCPHAWVRVWVVGMWPSFDVSGHAVVWPAP